MCTLSIFKDSNSIKVTMNRDEMLDREPEVSPYLWPNGIYAPQDVAAGGTWIGLHQGNRQWACLLNGYSPLDDKRGAVTSRGHIIPDLLELGFDSFEQNIQEIINDYHSFRLIYGDDRHVNEITWDGDGLKGYEVELFDDGWVFRSSSSWEQKMVVEYRANMFRRWRRSFPYKYVAANSVPAFHVESAVGEEALSILMKRDNPVRATTSITVINIGEQGAEMDYYSSQSDHAGCLCALKAEDL